MDNVCFSVHTNPDNWRRIAVYNCFWSDSTIGHSFHDSLIYHQYRSIFSVWITVNCICTGCKSNSGRARKKLLPEPVSADAECSGRHQKISPWHFQSFFYCRSFSWRPQNQRGFTIFTRVDTEGRKKVCTVLYFRKYCGRQHYQLQVKICFWLECCCNRRHCYTNRTSHRNCRPFHNFDKSAGQCSTGTSKNWRKTWRVCSLLL